MATQKFLTAWRGNAAASGYYTLVRIDVPRADGTQTDTLYLSTATVSTPANSGNGDPVQMWGDGVIAVQDIHRPGGLGSTDMPLTTGGLVLNAQQQVTFVAGVGPAITETLRASMATHVWQSASISIFRWLPMLTDFVDAQCVFSKAGVIGVQLDGDADQMVLSLRQVIPWNKPLILRTLTKQDWPRAVDAAVGLSFPLRLGNPGVPMRRPWAAAPSKLQYYSALSAGRPTARSRSILVDPGRGGTTGQNILPRIYTAGHAVKSVVAEATGSDAWLKTDTNPALLLSADPTGGSGATFSLSSIVPFNASDGAGFTLPNTGRCGMLGWVPGELVQQSNMADNARAVLDPSDASFALFDVSQSKSRLCVLFPNLADISDGGNVALDFVVGYEAYVNTNFNLGLNSTTPILNATPDFPNSTYTPPTILRFPYGSPNSAWPSFGPTPFSIGFAGTTAIDGTWGWAKVYFCGIVIYFRPKAHIVQSERVISLPDLALRREQQGYSTPFTVPERTPPVTEVLGDFLDRSLGAADDTAGTFTGTPTTQPVIERAPDLMVYLLNFIAGVPLSDIERAGGAFGSLTDARALLQVNTVDPVHCVDITETVDILTALLWLAADSLTQLHVSPYDNKNRLIVWDDNMPLTYPTLIAAQDVVEPLGPEVNLSATSDVVTDIRVSYGLDGDSGQYRCETSLAPDRSNAGYEFKNVRDQNLTVLSGKNDRLDMRSNNTAGTLGHEFESMTAHTVVLTPGTYIPQSAKTPQSGQDYTEGMAQQLKGQLAWAEGTQAAGSRYQVTWGTAITVNYNDKLRIQRGGVAVTLLLTPNDGTQTCEQLAADVQAKVRAQFNNTFSCSYNRATRKFEVISTENPITAAWYIVCADAGDYTSPHLQYSAWASLGFYQAGASRIINGVGTVVADDVRIEEHFAIMSLGGSGSNPSPKLEFELLFQSGANFGADGATPRHCADLLGFVPEDKLVGFSQNTGHSYCADAPKGGREAQMQTAATLYGRRRELAVQARTLQKGIGPRALRNRIADLFRAPRAVITFTTAMMPDVESGHVFGFNDEMARPYPAPGTDGKWVGKKFVVLEYAHSMGPTSLTTQIMAADIGQLASIAVAIGTGVMMGMMTVRLT